MKRLYLLWALFFASFFYDIYYYNAYYVKNDNYKAMVAAIVITLVIFTTVLLYICYLDKDKNQGLASANLNNYPQLSVTKEEIIARKNAFQKAHKFIKKFDKDFIFGDIELENEHVNLSILNTRGEIGIKELAEEGRWYLDIRSEISVRVTNEILMRFKEDTTSQNITDWYHELTQI